MAERQAEKTAKIRAAGSANLNCGGTKKVKYILDYPFPVGFFRVPDKTGSMNSSGKSHRKGIDIIQLLKMFPDETAARRWFEGILCPTGPICPHCGSAKAAERKKAKPQPNRCRECRRDFSVRYGTIMQDSRLPLQKWALACYMVCTNLKGVTSVKLHRDLGITQKSAWFMMRRIREAFPANREAFAGPVEVDETYVGGKRKNMPKSKRYLQHGRGPVGKTTVVGAKDRATNKIAAAKIDLADKETLPGFVESISAPGAKVYTDEAKAYGGIDRDHGQVNHSAGE